MRLLSASEAISPAWEHTKRLLFTNRDWRLLLKIGLVACFAQLGGGFNFNLGRTGKVFGVPTGSYLAGAIFGLLLLFCLGLVLFYIGSRLQFVLFEVVLRQDTRIGPIWQRYGAVTWRWIGLKLLLFVGLLLCMVPLLAPVFLFAVKAGKGTGHAATGFGGLILSFLGIFLIVFVLALLFGCVYLLLDDFGIPSMALEDTGLGETWRRVWSLVRAEPGQVALFILLRFVLALAGSLISYLALLIVLLVLAVPLGGLAFADRLLLQHASGAGHVAMIAGWVVLGVTFAVLAFAAAAMLFGIVLVFVEAYALYFLGGRYPRVGEYLEPTVAYPFTPPPLAGPDEGDDDGPSLPMNPALA